MFRGIDNSCIDPISSSSVAKNLSMAVDTLAIWKKAVPSVNVALLKEVDFYLKKHADKYGVNTAARLAAFMSQAMHETDNLRGIEEYASGAAYEGRKDLGNTYKGDGIKFKGRGLLHITGRANYTALSKYLFGDTRLLNNPRLLAQPEYAVLAGLWFWKTKNLNRFADRNDFTGLTRIINGGTNGLADRLMKWDAIKMAIASVSPVLFIGEFVKKKANDGWLWNIGSWFRSSSPGAFSYNNYE
jgi:putative chitinase